MGSTPCYYWECGDGQGSCLFPGRSVCVREQVKDTESENECSVQRACNINEITLADGSHLESVPQPLRSAAGSHAPAHIHSSSLLLSVPLTTYFFFSRSFYSVLLFYYSCFPSLSFSLCSSFIHREIWPRRPSFQAITVATFSPHTTPFFSACPTLPLCCFLYLH